jgi:hypothetical protein
VFWSMWRSRAAECPWGSGRPATETVLLHHEQFKIPERLARFAVTHGMWGFIKKLGATVPQYVAARRLRCAAGAEDPAAFGAAFAPNPPAGPSSDSGDSSSDGASSAGGGEAAAGGGGAYRPRRRRVLPGARAALLIGGLALVARVGSRGSGLDQEAAAAEAAADTAAAAAAAPREARHGRRHHRHGHRRPDSQLLLLD